MLRLVQAGTYHPIDVSVIEKAYKASYIGFWTIKGKHQNWTDMPVEVFYQPNPDASKGHSEYFGIYLDQYDRLMICDAASFCPPEGIGVTIVNDEVVASHYRHDMRYDSNGAAFMDGGRDYTRSNGVGVFGKMTVDKGKFFVVADGSSESSPVKFVPIHVWRQSHV